MSLPRYPEYRDSGVPWVGEIPARWRVMPLLGVAHERYESNLGLKEENLLSLSYGRVVRKDMSSNEGLLPDSFETYQVLHPGDVVFRLTDLQNDKRSLRTAPVLEKGIITSAYLAVAPKNLNPAYFAHLLRCYDLTKVFYSMGGGLRQSMKYADVKRLPILVPPTEDQMAIADFLDRETAKIDDLIAEQEKLLALLSEKRRATISRAVTLGLNQNPPMKGSGIPWLCEVPAHWQVIPLKRTFASVDYGISDSLGPSGEVAVLRMGNIQNGKVLFDDLKYVDEVDQALLLHEGDLLFNRTNSIDLVGKVGLFNGQVSVPTSFASYLVRLRLGQGYDVRYFAHLLNMEGLLGLVRASAFVAIGQCNLNPTRYGEILVAVPPLEEQLAIAAHLDAEVSSCDALQTQAERLIALLRERRSALIAAAVTGKIDVRGAIKAQAA